MGIYKISIFQISNSNHKNNILKIRDMNLKKNIISPCFLLSGFLVFGISSCKDDKLINNTNETSKELAVEIIQVKENIQVAENLNVNDYAEFTQGDYIKSLSLNLTELRSATEDENDTIKNAEEIPIVRQEELSQKIFSDGSFEYITEDKTSEDMMFIENMSLTPQSESEKVSKTVIKDDVATLYNQQGDVIETQNVGSMNFKPLLDSLKLYLTAPEQRSSNAIEARKTFALNKALKSGMRLKSQSSNDVILEMDMGTSASILPTNKLRSAVSKKAIMRFSSDMSKMYSQKIYEGGQLVQSVEIEYATGSESNLRSVASDASISSLIPNTNIKLIKRKDLMFNDKGKPMIMNYIESYTKNKVIYHFLNK